MKQHNKRWLQLLEHADVTEICFGTHTVNKRNETCGVLQPLRTFSWWNDSLRKYTTEWSHLYLTVQCSSQRAGGADRLEGENVIFDPITDDAKSVPPVMQKPNISHTHTHTRRRRGRLRHYAWTHSLWWCEEYRTACICLGVCSCLQLCERLCADLVYLLLCENYWISCIYTPTPFKSQLTHFGLSLTHTHNWYTHLLNIMNMVYPPESQHFHLCPL